MPAQTLAQKLIAKACGKAVVDVDDIVTCNVDLAMFHDSSGPRRLKPMLERLGAGIWDKSKVVLVMDHYVPEEDEESRHIVKHRARLGRATCNCRTSTTLSASAMSYCRRTAISGPACSASGGDSHSPTGGAFGAYMFGVGSTEMLGVVVTGEIWLRVPENHLMMRWDGALAARRHRQGHDAAHDRPLRHERRPTTRPWSSAGRP